MQITHFARPVACAVLLAVLALWPAAARAIEPGQHAADFEAPALDGKGTISLAAYRGKVVYLDFWASWCDPCAKALPVLDSLRKEFPAKDFQVLAVNVDSSKRKAQKFLARHPVGYPSASDPQGRLPQRFGLETMPTSYLIDRKGVVRYVHRGFRTDDADEIRSQIAAWIAR